MSRAILVLNAGSSSLKFSLSDAENLGLLCRGKIDDLGDAATFSAHGPLAAPLLAAPGRSGAADHAAATHWLLGAIRQHLPDVTLHAAGHRVVHGGAEFAAPVLVDATTLARLEALVPLAPNHQPANVAAIRAVAANWPGLPQVATFDTAFHRNQPRLNQLYALPRALADEGVVRYGFHGLSYEYIASVLPEHLGARAEGRVVVAHLGHGASLCALHGRRSVTSSMGFSTLDGLMMSTRCGTLDVGVVLYLLRQGRALADVEDLLYDQSGLLGISGLAGDVRELEASDDPRASEALALFALYAARELGSLVAVLGGLDALVFTAGIGENSSSTRARIAAHLAWLGVELDEGANRQNAALVSAAGSRVEVHVIPTDEEVVITRAVQALTQVRHD